MRRWWMVPVLALGLAACETDEIFLPGGPAAAPRNVDASYYAGAVTVTWELAPDWNGEPFRVYSKRTSDADYFLIAEVTSCQGGLCSYRDENVVEGRTYQYYVAAVDLSSGAETASDVFVEVAVPMRTPPPVPDGVEVVALDGVNYVRWGTASRGADDFSFYRVYFEDAAQDVFLLGETDSEGFVDERVLNGETYGYFVTAVDSDGHESGGSALAEGTPRPDFHGELLYADSDRPDASGFRFQADESTDPVLDGGDPDRHFRLEVDADGWWLVPGPEAAVYPDIWETTALKCGVGADAGCTDVIFAPTSGYVAQDLEVLPGYTYVMRVRGDDGLIHYGALRVEMVGFDQDGDALMIFDWSYQLQANNPALMRGPVDLQFRAPQPGVPARVR